MVDIVTMQDLLERAGRKWLKLFKDQKTGTGILQI